MWILQASTSALLDSWNNAAIRSTKDRWSAESVAWWQRCVAALTVTAFALIWSGAPSAPSASAWVPAAISIVFNAGITLLCIRALQSSDLSLTAPIMALSPVLLLVTEPIMTGEAIPPLGILGALVIALGLYVLNLPDLRKHGLLGPFRAVWREPGPRAMLFVVLAWSVTAPLDRMAVRAWDPLWYSASLQAGVGLLITPFWIRKRRVTEARPWRLMLVGLMQSGATACQMAAMAVAPATYVVALRRFSAPLGVVWGKLLFKEAHFLERMLGAVIMAAGAVIILMSL